jgi:hypothetical protein
MRTDLGEDAFASVECSQSCTSVAPCPLCFDQESVTDLSIGIQFDAVGCGNRSQLVVTHLIPCRCEGDEGAVERVSFLRSRLVEPETALACEQWASKDCAEATVASRRGVCRLAMPQCSLCPVEASVRMLRSIHVSGGGAKQ